MPRLASPLAGARAYVAVAALLLLAAAVASAVQPSWFVAPTGRVAVFGGPLAALAIGVGLWRGSRLAYAFAVVGALGWAGVAARRSLDGGVGAPAAQALLAAAMAAVVVLLLAPAAVRRHFGALVAAPRDATPRAAAAEPR